MHILLLHLLCPLCKSIASSVISLSLTIQLNFFCHFTDKVLYKDLGTLYFSPGEKTRARRTYSVPQLVCLKGCHYPQPKQVQCTNAGWDGSSNLVSFCFQ